MQKVIVIGCSGAGKSTFSRNLRDRTGLPLYYLDMIWHKPDKTTYSREEFDLSLDNIIRQDKWIIDGNFSRTLPVRMAACDTVFLLDMPLEVCLAGVTSRIGTKREEMPWVEDGFDADFKLRIENFAKDELPQIYELLKKHSDKKVIVFKSHAEIDTYLENL